MDDNGEAIPAQEPRSVIHLEAEVGSSKFEISTNNCDPLQLFGAAKVLEMLGMELFADIRAQQIMAGQAANRAERRLAVARRLPT